MAANNVSTTYRVIRVPKSSPRVVDLVNKFRTSKLLALETDPTSFLSQHAVESKLPLEVWSSRLSRDATILICVATDHISTVNGSAASDDEAALIEGEWVGFAAIRGPMKNEEYYVTPDMNLQMPEDPSTEARWHVYDLYTLPAHRGRGLAKQLVNACNATAVEYTKALSLRSDNSLKQARIRLFMNPKNTWLTKAYENLGFQASGKVTLEEGFRANALDESIPEDTRATEELEKMWHTRFGLAMEQVISIEGFAVWSNMC